MYIVDKETNRISSLKENTFSKLGIREREHLQEWIAGNPSSLGEELLIIQKEFDGFDETRERLDLLALDKSGQLVIIENKLDDSGRDVVWQAVKYAAYCSRLNKDQIVEIFQSFLDRYHSDANAREILKEFLEVEDLDEIILNEGNDQRIFFIAANFRKEATATVLWLISHGIRAQCFKATPYELEDSIILDISQIIPTPEAEDFMISMASKDAEEKISKDTQKHRYEVRRAFWQKCLEHMKISGIEIFRNVSPSKDNWVNASSGTQGCSYSLVFNKNEARVQFEILRGDRDTIKRLFDKLLESRLAIDQSFGEGLIWLRLDDKKHSRIEVSREFAGYDQDNWPKIIEWMTENTQRLESTLRPHLNNLWSSI